MSYNPSLCSFYNSKELKNDSIDYDFYKEDFEKDEVENKGVKSIEIKPIIIKSENCNLKNEKYSTKQKTDSLTNTTRKAQVNLMKCIAYTNTGSDSNSSSGEESGIDNRSNNGETSESSNEVNGFRSSNSPDSDLTIITPRSTVSDCSTYVEDKEGEDEHQEDEDICSITSEGASTSEDNLSENNNMELLSHAVDHMRLHNNFTQIPFSPWARHGRRNMTFSNEQVRQINRENDILLRKIMDHSKPRRTPLSKVHSPPLIKASSGVNRSKQLKEIERENYIMLKRIRAVKPTQKIYSPKPKI